MFYEKVKDLCDQMGISVTEFAKRIGVSQSNVTSWKSGASPRSKTLKQASDFFGVSTSYFLLDEKAEIQTVQDNHGIIGNTHAPVTINGAEVPGAIGEIEREILSICSKLDTKRKAALLARAYELLEEK